MKLWWSLMAVAVALLVMIAATNGESDLWEEDDKEVLVRTVRGTKERASSNPECRYTKGQWSECDAKTNKRTRTLSLKKGDKLCQQTKIMQKKCKKACRYEKGQWRSCENGTITRIDTLKENSDPSCEKTRRLEKKCKPELNTRKSAKGDRSNKKSGKQQ